MSNKKFPVAVLGAGNMGTAIAQIISQNGYDTRLWNHEGDSGVLNTIKETGENKKYMPGMRLSANITPEPDLETALGGALVVFFVVPSNFMEALIKRAASFLPCGVVCVDASKGLDEKSLGLIPDVIDKNLPDCLARSIVSISGPAIARDMANGGFTAMDIAGKNTKAIKLVQAVMENDHLKLLPTTDMVGVEVAGSFKNVYAIAMGICDGLGHTLNAKSALLVMAMREIASLIKKMGGKKETVYGLSGLGDLVGTGLCADSRNRRFGEYIAKGKTKEEAAKAVGQTVEGVNACQVLMSLGKKYRVKLPFAEMINAIIWQKKPAASGLKAFLKKFN